MNLSLSWNLFVIAIFVVIIAYSYIIGLNRTVKSIVSAYLAILAADGLGNIFHSYFLESSNFRKGLELFNITNLDETLISTKVVIFVAVVVILTVRGAFEVDFSTHNFGSNNLVVTGIFGFLNAGLIVSTLLVYVSGMSFVQKVTVESNIVDLYTSSTFIKAMVDYYNLWFSIPVVVIIVWSVLFNGKSE